MSGSTNITYSWVASPFGTGPGFIQRSSDNAMIPCNLENTDYQSFLAWLAAGNTAPSGWTGPRNPTTTTTGTA